jgi:4-amino-4-deoxy-L-arabinose transferase-like glycosyltransferase
MEAFMREDVIHAVEAHLNGLEVRDPSRAPHSIWSSDVAILTYIAVATIVVHLFTGERYGFHRDELATVEDARHLAWGFVAYPPITPFFGRLSLILFDTSLTGFRFFAAVVEAIAVVLTGLMARELGGKRGAQLVAAAAALPVCLGGGSLMQYVAFDYFFWVLTAYFVVRLLRTDDPRWWLAIGASIGFGMEAKYTMGFFALAVVGALVLTSSRRYLKSKWLWYGVALSILVLLPNLLWQARHHFVSLAFLQHIHTRDVRQGHTKYFLLDQLRYTIFAVPLWLSGLYFYLISPKGARFRMLGWMYVHHPRAVRHRQGPRLLHASWVSLALRRWQCARGAVAGFYAPRYGNGHPRSSLDRTFGQHPPSRPLL